MKKFVHFFLFVIFFAFLVGNVFAGFNCVDDPSSTSVPPMKRCEEDPNVPHGLKECLSGYDINCGTPGNPVCTIVRPPCKDDPRYQLRNFAPFLNFPTIGSMLNLGVALITTVAGLMCGVIMFYGAYRYLSAGGEMKKIEEARNRMIYAGIGLLVVLLAYSIVKVLLDITSTNTVRF